MDAFAGKVAVVTGAGSGIGRALAVELARRGAKLAISDIDERGSRAIPSSGCGSLGATSRPIASTSPSVRRSSRTPTRSTTHFGTVNQIYNNAGIAFLGDVEVSDFKDIERVIDVDFWGVVNGTKAFLPHLIASGDGHVVNISSMFGLFAIHGQAPYHAAKFAVRGFTEALRQEMRLAGHPVKVTCVHPGYIKTDIVRNMSIGQGVDTKALVGTFDKIARTSPERVARTVLRRRRQEQGTGPARHRRQDVRPDRAADRLGLHAGAVADPPTDLPADALI